MNEKVQLAFDEENRLRALEPEKFEQTQEMEREAATFASKVRAFDETAHALVESLEEHASRIERVKLKAIGQRNRLEAEEANSERQTQQLRQLIHERRTLLDRLTREQEALEKVEAEQAALLKKLANNEL